MTDKKIPGDRLVLGLFSAFRSLVLELASKQAIDLDQYLHVLDETADAHSATGDPNRLADAIRAIRNHISESSVKPEGQIQ
jgi:hypothetical protein